MDLLGRILPDSPGRHRVCGRECSDGSPCGNMVERPGDACWIDSHRREDPRVDGGPTSPDEVPLSGSGGGAVRAGFVVGKGLAVAVAAYLGLGYFLADILIHVLGIILAVVLALALDAYQRRALSEGETTGE